MTRLVSFFQCGFTSLHVAIISVVVPLRPPGLQSNKTEGERVSEGETESEAEELKENKRGTERECVFVAP